MLEHNVGTRQLNTSSRRQKKNVVMWQTVGNKLVEVDRGKQATR